MTIEIKAGKFEVQMTGGVALIIIGGVGSIIVWVVAAVGR